MLIIIYLYEITCKALPVIFSGMTISKPCSPSHALSFSINRRYSEIQAAIRSTAGIEVIQLAVSIGEVLLIEIRNRGFRDIADRVELDLADAVICVVAVLDEFPVAVAGVVSVTETGVGANALRR